MQNATRIVPYKTNEDYASIMLLGRPRFRGQADLPDKNALYGHSYKRALLVMMPRRRCLLNLYQSPPLMSLVLQEAPQYLIDGLADGLHIGLARPARARQMPVTHNIRTL